MSAIASQPIDTRKSLLRSIVVGGGIIFVLQLIHTWLIYSVLQGNPFIGSLQYMASGALGESAFAGDTGTALVGVLFHLIVSLVIAAVFILSADRIPFLRRNIIAGALLYGFGVWIVMNFIVLPLSAAPPLPAPPTPWLIEGIIEHMLAVGLPLAILVRRSASLHE
ncbi:MAG: hypothetical protein K8L99_22045 [Anaerolineae bacterium]|nr:hypothetical protein [Anaerolineae bacterium]